MVKAVVMKTEDLIPYENNPRRNDKAVEAVAKSIKEFGFKNPIIVDKDNVIVSGHTRRLAALMLGLKAVPVIVSDDLTDEQIKAFRLADNRVAELAVWDDALLEKEMAKVIDMDLTDYGFDAEAVERVIQEDVGVRTHRCPRCGCEWTAKDI